MKSESETNSEILLSAKSGDDPGISEIRVRNIRSVHPVQCQCSIHRNLQLREYSSQKELEEKEKLDWYE